MADNEENSNKRLAKTSEHGKILMTISNLAAKIHENFPQLTKRYEPNKDAADFNDMARNETVALEHLEFIKTIATYCHMLAE